ncbi:MAG: hypothetical protein ACTS3F_00300 [Phycisphaerales bacterium]
MSDAHDDGMKAAGAAGASAGGGGNGAVLRTRLNRPWVFRVVGLFIGLAALSCWFALDAWVIYPKRGEKAIDFAELKYLQEAASAGLVRTQIDVMDPAAEREGLASARRDPAMSLSAMEAARLEWLTAVSRLHDLEEVGARNQRARDEWSGGGSGGGVDGAEGALTVFEDPAARLSALSSELAQATAPKPLSTWDLPSQYISFVVCFVAAVAMLVFFFRIRGQVYTYRPANRELTLPDGTSFTPEKIQRVDKRKWDKFIVFLTLEGEGSERKIDLFRHAPLEEWILEMEKHHPNYEPEEDDEDEDGEGDGEAAGDGDGGGDGAEEDDRRSLRTE